jgi:hypothetical protein
MARRVGYAARRGNGKLSLASNSPPCFAEHMIKHCSVWYALGFTVCLLFGCGKPSETTATVEQPKLPSQPAAKPEAKPEVQPRSNKKDFAESFLAAVEADDRQTVMHRLDAYQDALDKIHRDNPKSLWPNLTAQLDARGVQEFWRDYEYYRSFFTPKHRREVTETRRAQTESMELKGGMIDRRVRKELQEYVTVSYSAPFPALTFEVKVPNNLAIMDGGFVDVETEDLLKQCIFALTFDEETGVLLREERLQAGNVAPTGEERSQMMRDAGKLLVGTWRDENSETRSIYAPKMPTVCTYNADGTMTANYDAGHANKKTWSLVGDTITVRTVERDGRRVEDERVATTRIVRITASNMITKDMPDGLLWHASRVK